MSKVRTKVSTKNNRVLLKIDASDLGEIELSMPYTEALRLGAKLIDQSIEIKKTVEGH